VWGDAHYDDQTKLHAAGRYRPQHLLEDDVQTHSRSTLVFKPKLGAQPLQQP